MSAAQIPATVPGRLSRLFSYPSTAQSQDRLAAEELITILTQAFFEPLAGLQAAYISSSQKSQLDTQIILRDFRGIFEKKIIETLASSISQPQSAVEALLNTVHPTLKWPYWRTASNSLQQIRQLFPEASKTIASYAEVLRKEAIPLQPIVSPTIEQLAACLATAVQRTVLATPATYYGQISDTVPDAIKSTLEDVLAATEYLRRHYALNIEELPSVSITLNMEVARANKGGSAWLPMRSLVTAPLQEKEDLQLYARGLEGARNLARRIMKHDGVMLITGYRGVGKSTFINQAIMLCHTELQPDQQETPPWLVIPIIVSLAKASGVDYALRLCIRQLYETLMRTPRLKACLTRDEQNHLYFAYSRAIYKVSMQQESSTATLRHLEGQLGWSIKPAGMLPSQVNPLLTALLPQLDASAKISRDDSRKLDSTIALLDYDENAAEDDLIRFIKALASPHLPPVRKARFKLIFVFDEVDKMSDKDQTNLINQLKNLFLARYAAFLLVTSKEFYYTWLEERKKEDTVLSSYFSGVEMVPLFTSEETLQLLKNQILLEKDKLQLNPHEEKVLKTYAQYLTYRARGIPRDIIRELQIVERWSKKGLQPFITDTCGPTDRVNPYHTVLVYAQLQLFLEEFLHTALKTILGGAVATPPTPPLSTSGSPSASSDAATLATGEEVWINEGRREQMRLGLYILIEELLDLGRLVIEPESNVLKEIWENSFKMLAQSDFNELLKLLCRDLPAVRLSAEPDSELARAYPGSNSLDLFTLREEEPDRKILRISELFRDITGRVAALRSSNGSGIVGRPDYTLDELLKMLQREEFLPKRIAVNVLQQQTNPLTPVLYQQLCQLFIAEGNIELRQDGVSLLRDNTAVISIFEIDQAAIEHFLRSEQSEQLLQEFARVLSGAASAANSAEKQRAATHSFVLLLHRCLTSRIGKPSPEEFAAQILSTLTTIADEDILDQCLNALDQREDIKSEPLLKALMALARKYNHNLVEALVSRAMNTISLETFQTILRTQTIEELDELWRKLLARKSQSLGQRALVALLLQRHIQGASSVVEWLNKAGSDDFDKQIIRGAKAANPAVSSTLAGLAQTEEARQKIANDQLEQPTGQTAADPEIPLLGPVSPRRRALQIALGLLMVGLLITYFVVQPDQSEKFVLWQRTVSLLLETINLAAALAFLIAGISFLVGRSTSKISNGITALVALIVGIIGIATQLIWFRPEFTLWGQVGLIGLLVATAGAGIGWLVSLA